MGAEEKLVRVLFGGERSDWDRYAGSFSTAGRQMRAISLMIRRERDATTDLWLSEKLEELRFNLRKSFAKLGTHVEDTFASVDELPSKHRDDAREELLVLMCLLQPSQYRHLRSYSDYLQREFATEERADASAMN